VTNYQPPRAPGQAAQRASRTGWVGAASGTGRIAGAAPVRPRARAHRSGAPAAAGGGAIRLVTDAVLLLDGGSPVGIRATIDEADVDFIAAEAWFGTEPEIDAGLWARIAADEPGSNDDQCQWLLVLTPVLDGAPRVPVIIAGLWYFWYWPT